MLVREAREEDWPRVAGLLAQLGRPAVADAVDADEHRATFARYLARDEAVALVAEDDDGSIVGFLDLEMRPRLNFLAPQAWIPDLIVDEGSRSRGVGGALLARAEEIARERGCWGITLESATWREDAHRFYLREGWDQAGHYFVRSLDGRPWPPPPR